MGLFGYRLLLKIENLLLKILSKIIFKCVNSAIGPSLKVDFAKFRTCESREQYTEPRTQGKKHKCAKRITCRYPNSQYMYFQVSWESLSSNLEMFTSRDHNTMLKMASELAWEEANYKKLRVNFYMKLLNEIAKTSRPIFAKTSRPIF